MKLRKILSGLKARYLPTKEKIIDRELFGKQLKVIEGTIRKKVDYDDAWFYFLASHSKVFFDVGANIGYTAILATLTKSIERVVLVDPNPQALIFASKNLILNNLAAKCSFFTAFVNHEVGNDVKFYTIGVGAAGSMYPSHAKTASMIDNFYYVRSITIDYLADYYHLDPDLVKVDVEGAEYSALRGATQLAKKNNTRFLVEMHRLAEVSMEQNGNNVIAWAQEVDYKVWYLTDNCELLSGDQIAHRGKCHLLLQPAAWPYPEFLYGMKQGSELPDSVQ